MTCCSSSFRPIYLRLAQGEAVTVRGDRADMTTLRLQQHSVEVIADVLLRHREVRLLDQPPEHRLVECNRLAGLDLFDTREIRPPAASANANFDLPDRTCSFSPLTLTAHIGRFWQRTADIQEFSS